MELTAPAFNVGFLLFWTDTSVVEPLGTEPEDQLEPVFQFPVVWNIWPNPSKEYKNTINVTINLARLILGDFIRVIINILEGKIKNLKEVNLITKLKPF